MKTTGIVTGLKRTPVRQTTNGKLSTNSLTTLPRHPFMFYNISVFSKVIKVVNVV